ncbi:MAG: PVC-type heme-binding CxxCH protein [Planctomycetota bacterium]|nr:PVC-type heme-binding CxxCH protein [Planctomycetota bacterium]
MTTQFRLILVWILFAGITILLTVPWAIRAGDIPEGVVSLTSTTAQPTVEEPDYRQYGIYHQTAPRAAQGTVQTTTLPLQVNPGARIALIGNNLLDRSQFFGYLETLIQQQHPQHKLSIRNLAWSADTADIQPRPQNFADTVQHLTHEKADIIIAAFGFNESFQGETGQDGFRESLSAFIRDLQSRQFNGKTGPQIVLLSPTANENMVHVAAADQNNEQLQAYSDTIRTIAQELKVAYIDTFTPTAASMINPKNDLTINGCHLNDAGYQVFAAAVFKGLFSQTPPTVNETIRQTVLDKNRQYFRRYRPVNTFYYTGGRNKTYGYLDFLPAMRNFDMLVANRDQRIWDLAQGKSVTDVIDDSNLPPLPDTKQSRGANRWMSAEDELKSFIVDPRFNVNLFAGEEEFPDIAAPIQMRWDAQGRLWVSCSKTYPHVYPGNEPNDKLVVLEDTDGDGHADKSTVFADDLHIPLSFEFGDGGVYVSEMPNLTFLKDTNGDGKADLRRVVLSGFGTEDSHHALHDFAWTPDGDLIFRESIFHHSQVETVYGPVRQQNSGWFRFQPRDQKLISFGTYPSTNPWGVTFDDWGQHQASHPVFAAAFHALDPPYPQQNRAPAGLRAYSGVCGAEFVDFNTFPDELRGDFIKVRYKPTNRVEIHKWNETDFGYDEQYVGDLIFSKNLSFIPVDLRYGPRGAMYLCDWYNPVKGHAQYSLRDERRDRHSGRIWRITAKGKPLQDPPRIAGASIQQLLDLHQRPEYRYRYWAKRELRMRDADQVRAALDTWVNNLNPQDPRFRHHQIEAIWIYRNINKTNPELLRSLLSCEDHHARAAATEQLRYWHVHMHDHIELLQRAANDTHSLVRMQAAIAASYIGTAEALQAMLDVADHPLGGHLAYAVAASLNSHTLRPHWEGSEHASIQQLLRRASQAQKLQEPPVGAKQAQFDSQKNLKSIKIHCLAERMRFSVESITATVGQPLKILFTNEDATDHNMVFVKPGALAEVGMAANEMARDPKNANSDFVPASKKNLILQASPMIGPTRKSRVHVFRFHAPDQPGVYPYVCTFPGHWVIMKGILVVGKSTAEAETLLAAQKPSIVQQWKMADFKSITTKHDEATIMRGMDAFMKARCHQCHKVGGHGINLGPELRDVAKRFKGMTLLEQIIEPSKEVNEKYRIQQFIMKDGRVLAGVLTQTTSDQYHIVANLLTPDVIQKIPKKGVEEMIPARLSPMPQGLIDTLTVNEIIDLVSFLEAGGYQLPKHLEKEHKH